MNDSAEGKPASRRKTARRSPAKHQTAQEPPSTEEAGGAAPIQDQEAPEDVATGTGRPDSFPIVGVGASAGGLSAFEQFFSRVPKDAEDSVAFVLVQHLDPDRASMLASLLSGYTEMPIEEAAEGVRIRPGHVYTNPPNRDIAIADGVLQLTEPVSPRGLRLPIDFFFRSLAQDQREHATGVVLSGTGTDGTLGLKAIKEVGGLVMVQAPETAQYDGMPRSALATGLADYVLAPSEMPEQLLEFQRRVHEGIRIEPARQPVDRTALALQRVLSIIRTQTGHDFSRYKQTTILRRVERRLAFHQIERMDAYARYLQRTPAEVNILFKELLIGVTNFFRDPEAYQALEDDVIPGILSARRSGEMVRVWVPGCSTGEEAYSIAMLLQEGISRAKQDLRVQVFATDIDADAIEQARTAFYPDSIAADVSSDRLNRFFKSEDSAYRLKKLIRDMVIFALQDVATDPPFSRIDLISCRNLLIYMSADLQRRVIPLFHYALNPEGYLFLGTSETIGEFGELFQPVNRRWKIFRRKPGLGNAGLAVAPGRSAAKLGLPRSAGERHAREKPDIGRIVEQVLLTGHTPPAAVVNENGDVVYFQGRTGQYLEPAPGEASLNLVKMAREGLRAELLTSLRKAADQRIATTRNGLRVRTNGSDVTINLLVRPLVEAGPVTGLYLVVFQELPHAADESVVPPPGVPDESVAPPPGAPDESAERLAFLERELHGKEEHLQATIEELETSNEELTSTNEELQSANEELQSTNEELETSKEELQSVNEELMTVNVELQRKIEELSRANNDLNNLLAGTGIGTVFVDYEGRIQRFTPAATEIINVIKSDIGRPVSHLVSNLVGYQDLARDVNVVLDTLVPKEADVQLRDGRWYLMRIQPYRTLENVIEGAVITFVNITQQKKLQATEASLRSEAERLRRMVSSIQDAGDAISVQDFSGYILSWNAAAVRLYGWSEVQAVGSNIGDYLSQEQFEELQRLTRGLQRGEDVKPLETERRARDGRRLRIRLSLTPALDAEGKPYALTAIERVLSDGSTDA
jgi:two-component system CheB/CheR fusion protein